MELRIVCAAIRNDSGDIICGPRHYDQTMQQQIRNHCGRSTWTHSVEQGFIDSQGNYHTREDAFIIAEAANQIIRRVGSDTLNGGYLFSENLY